MCKAGGPRCPETQGKKARSRFNHKINKLISESGESTDEWKVSNASEYDALLIETFGPYQDSLDEEDDLSWLNYREMAQEEVYEEKDSSDYLESDEEDVDWDDLISDDPSLVHRFLENSNLFMSQGSEAWDEGPMALQQDEEKEEEEPEPIIAIRKTYVPSTNKHLLPEDADIESMNPNPVFVYGTLRSGHGNYMNVLEGNVTRSKEAQLPGASMYSNGGFPYVIDDENSQATVTGELMYLDYDNIVDTMDSLDTLEGTRELTNDFNLYNRCLRYVHVGDNKYVQAWVYMPPEVKHDQVKGLFQIETGDWNDAPSRY